MKKALLICSLLLSSFLFTEAQFKEIAASPEFKEPYSSSTKLLLLKNSNLILIDVGFRDSIRIRIYNAAHQEIAVTSYTMNSPAKKGFINLREAFEINGDVVLFVIAEEEKAAVFYRVIVDPNSGKVKKEEKIFGLKPLSKDEFYAAWMGNLLISKSDDNDSYAIVYCNNFQSDKIKKVEVVLFDKEHFEIGQAYYETPEKKIETLRFCSLQIINSEKVGLLFIGSTWDNKIGNEGRKLTLALMKKGSSNLSVVKLDFPEEKVPKEPQLYYNNYSKKLIVAAVCGGKIVDQYLCFVDPETEKAEKILKYDFNEAFYERGKDIYGRKYVFYGMPVRFIVEKNGNFSIVYEEGGDEITGGGSHSYYSDIIVAGFDKNGKVLNNYLVPRKVFINTSGGFSNNYIDLAYIKNKDKAYLFFNDFRENIERLEKDKDPKQVVVVKDCDAFYFPLTGTEIIPARKYLFGITDEKKEHIQSPFRVFVYDKENDVFITLRLNRDEKKRTKTVNVVWLKPE